MSRNFVVVVGGPTPEQNKLITEYLDQESGCGWWHWIDNFWLVVDPRESLTAHGIRQKIQELIPNTIHILVLQVEEGSDWSSWAPPSGHEWFKQNWNP